MLRITNLSEVKKQLRGVMDGMDTLMLSNGKDIVEEVKSDLNPSGSRLSPSSDGETSRPAIFEAVYSAELKNRPDLAESAERNMTNTELSRVEEEIVDRYLRDFINNAFRGV